MPSSPQTHTPKQAQTQIQTQYQHEQRPLQWLLQPPRSPFQSPLLPTARAAHRRRRRRRRQRTELRRRLPRSCATRLLRQHCLLLTMDHHRRRRRRRRPPLAARLLCASAAAFRRAVAAPPGGRRRPLICLDMTDSQAGRAAAAPVSLCPAVTAAAAQRRLRAAHPPSRLRTAASLCLRHLIFSLRSCSASLPATRRPPACARSHPPHEGQSPPLWMHRRPRRLLWSRLQRPPPLLSTAMRQWTGWKQRRMRLALLLAWRSCLRRRLERLQRRHRRRRRPSPSPRHSPAVTSRQQRLCNLSWRRRVRRSAVCGVCGMNRALRFRS